MQIIDDGGGGSGICTVSTSDLIGLQNNFLARISKLEEIVKLLTGMDVSANSLDEFSDSLGTVTNATLINAARGWITEGTFTGVGISTLGWTMYNSCTGQDEPFPIVVMKEDDDGNQVLDFGADHNGILCGEAVERWDAAAEPVELDYGIAWNGTGGSGSAVRGVTLDSNLQAGQTFTVSQAGLYQVSASVNYYVDPSPIASAEAIIRIRKTGDGTSSNGLYVRENYDVGGVGEVASFQLSPSVSGLIVCSAGDQIISVAETSTVGLSIYFSHLHIVRLSA